MDTNEFLSKVKTLKNMEFDDGTVYHFREIAPHMVLADGVTLSIQASRTHYCSPRQDDAYHYFAVEIGYPTVMLPEEFNEYADGEPKQDGVWGYVPVDLIDKFIADHGGIIGTETFVRGEDNKGISVITKFA
jgi:hypothetical protein